MKYILLIIGLMLLIGTASAAEYYVDNNTGNDGDDGLSLINAWLTLEHADGQLSAGDTLRLVDGTWNNQHFIFTTSGTDGNPITVTAYNGTPILFGVDKTGTGININGQSHINISDIAIRNYSLGISTHGFDGVTKIDITNVETSHTASSGIQLSNYISDSIINNCNVTGNGYNSIAIYGTNSDTSDDTKYTHNITVSNNLIQGPYGHSAIDLFGELENITVVSNNIVGDSTGGGMFTHTSVGSAVLCTNLNISYNVINGTGAGNVKGMYMESNDSLFSYNTVYDRTDQPGIYSDQVSNNVTYLRNILYNNYFGFRVCGNSLTYENNNNLNNIVADYVFDSGTFVVLNQNQNYSIARNGGIVLVRYDSGRIFSISGLGLETYYYNDKSELNYTQTGGSYSVQQYDMTVATVSGHGKDVVVNTNKVNDISNITVNVSEVTTVTMTFLVDNASNTYNLSVDSVFNTSAVSNSDSIVSFDYVFPSTTSTDFEVTWTSEEGCSVTSTPTDLTHTNGTTWINHTWLAGSDCNDTDSFNYSINGVWYNSSLNTSHNNSGLSPGNYSNITLGAWNSTYNELSPIVSENVQLPLGWSPTANTTYLGVQENWYTNGNRTWSGTQPSTGDPVVSGWQVVSS